MRAVSLTVVAALFGITAFGNTPARADEGDFVGSWRYPEGVPTYVVITAGGGDLKAEFVDFQVFSQKLTRARFDAHAEGDTLYIASPMGEIPAVLDVEAGTLTIDGRAYETFDGNGIAAATAWVAELPALRAENKRRCAEMKSAVEARLESAGNDRGAREDLRAEIAGMATPPGCMLPIVW